MYVVARKIKSAADQLEALQKLIKLSPPKETRQYFETYQRLDDSIQTERNAAKNQFALIRYETEKNKAENLNLQKDVTEKKFQITTQRLLLGVSLLVLIAGSIIAALWYKKRKQKMELEAKASIQNNRLKLSKKVHDVVANGLYRVMSEIENQEDLDKDSVLDKIELLYDKSRDISYEDSPVVEPNFKEKINSLITSFGSQATRVSLVGNEEELWDQVSPKAISEIEHVLQELMVNMKKHSHAANMVVKFEQIENQVNIYYTDDGIGINGGLSFNNGLTSTGNRIEGIGGTITFDTKTDKGLRIHIAFPVS